jgi:cell fate (sporulation/competence/biofilm development) regulator YlbF (YheA/YmcA/DUF963 family)
MTIVEKTQELGQMIIESEEYTAMQKAEMRQAADADAMGLIAEYNRKRAGFMQKLQNPETTPEQVEEIRKQMDEEYQNLTKNECIAEYIEAMQNFNNLMNQVNGIIAYYVNGQGSSDCTGNCSSCSGCH